MDYNLTTHFYLKPGRENVKGQYPVYLRITLNGLRSEISTNLSIAPDNWNKRAEMAKGNREEARIFNTYLDKLSAKVKRCFNDLLDSNNYFDVNALKNSINGKGKINKTLIQVYEENNKLMRQEESSKYVRNIVDRYHTSIERLKKFILEEYKVQYIPLDRLNYQFILRYEIFLRTQYANHHNTIMNYIKQLKKVIHQAIETVSKMLGHENLQTT